MHFTTPNALTKKKLKKYLIQTNQEKHSKCT